MKTKLTLAVIILSAMVTCGYAAGSIKLITGGCQWGEIDIDVLYLSKTQSFSDAIRIQGENRTEYTVGQTGGRYNSVNGWVHLQFGCTSYAPYSPLAGYAEWDVDLTGTWWLCMRYSKNSAEGNPIELQINDSKVTDWYAENQGSWERFDTIVWTLVDFGDDPYLAVSPNTRELSSEAGSTSFSVSSNVEWSASENSSWLSTTRDGSDILVNYEENAALESRQAIIRIEGGDLSEEVRITQAGEAAYLAVSPSSRELSAEAGTTSFSVSSNVEWSATENSSWLSTSRNGSTLQVNYEENAALESRQAIIRIDGGDLSEEVRITQAGEAAYLSVSPNTRELSSEAGSTSFSVSSNVEWSATENSSWLSTSRNGSTLQVNYEENAALESRQAIIRIEGEDLSEEVRITQAGEAAYLAVSPSSRELSAEDGTTSFSVSSNVEWSATENSSWLSTSRNGSTLQVNYEENAALESRQAIIRIEGGDLSEEVRITQAGEAAYLAVSPSSRELSAEDGTTSFSVSSNVEWSASENSSWLSTTRDGSDILVNYEENAALESRQAIIRIEGGDLSEEVRITQAGEAAYLAVSPNTRELSAEDGTTSFSVSSNVEWSASENSSWLSTTRDGSNILVNYEENAALESRQAIIRIEGGDLSEEVRITQAGEAAYLAVSPSSRELSAEDGTTSFSVSSNVEWSASENSSWLSTTRDGSDILVNYEENAALESRQAIIRIEGGDLSEEVRITQAGANIQYDTLVLYTAGQRYGTINIGYIVLSESNDRNNGIRILGYEPYDYSVGEIAYRSGAETSADHKVFNNLGCTNSAPWSAKSGSVYYLLPRLDPNKTYFYSFYYSQNVSPSPIEITINGKLQSVFHGFNGYDWNFFRWSAWHLLDPEYSEQNHSASKATSLENHNAVDGNAKVYPNPVHNLLTIEFDPAHHIEPKIVISDLLGKVVETRHTESVFSGNTCKEVFDFSSYHTGVYLYQVVSNANELLYRGKIVKH